MRSDPWFFLAIHTVLGCIVLGLWAVLYLSPADILLSKGLQVFFFLISIVFALHIWPERTG
ncbi:hypothetical protein TeGR_g9169, partial [Tetraparma gracilis]